MLTLIKFNSELIKFNSELDDNPLNIVQAQDQNKWGNVQTSKVWKFAADWSQQRSCCAMAKFSNHTYKLVRGIDNVEHY